MTTSVEKLRQKKSVEIVQRAHHRFALSYAEVERALGRTMRTVLRWKVGESAPSPDHRTSLEQATDPSL